MKAFSLHGPLAHYQRQVTELQTALQAAQQQAAQAQAHAEQQAAALHQERCRVKELEYTRIPALQNQVAALSATVEGLQSQIEIQRAQQELQATTAAAGMAALQAKLDAALADNGVLRGEVTKVVQTRQACQARVDAARRHLGMNKAEADAFIRVRAQTTWETWRATRWWGSFLWCMCASVTGVVA
jgi:chromosome segregation ATPase